MQQLQVEELPDEVLVYLLGSRYCETDVLMEKAWRLFDSAPFGWLRVQAICDFVHQYISTSALVMDSPAPPKQRRKPK